MPFEAPIFEFDPATHAVRLKPAYSNFFRVHLETQYLSRYLGLWRIGLAVPTLPGPEPQPVPFESATFRQVHDMFQGDLLLRALAEPQPQPSRFSVIEQIKKENLHIEVVKDLITRLEAGLDALQAELKTFESNSSRNCS